MGERPVIFSGPMVRALLAGTKTQTRRVVPRGNVYTDIASEAAEDFELRGWQTFCRRDALCAAKVKNRVGDRLWVREALTIYEREERNADGRTFTRVRTPMYAADYLGFEKPDRDWNWTPSIHMPRWASRLTLTVTDVRVHRVQDISEDDARAEGLDHREDYLPQWRGAPELPWRSEFPCDAFADLWDSIHGPGAWDANPWVVALTFTVQRGNIEALRARQEAGDG